MNQTISEAVSVCLVTNHDTHAVAPTKVKWNGRIYPVTKIGLHHTYREGRTLLHVFSVMADTIFMRLILNSETLSWKLEQISEVGASI